MTDRLMADRGWSNKRDRGSHVPAVERVNPITARPRQHNTDALQQADTVPGCPVSPAGGTEDGPGFRQELTPSIPRPPARQDNRHSSTAPRPECGCRSVCLLTARLSKARMESHAFSVFLGRLKACNSTAPGESRGHRKEQEPVRAEGSPPHIGRGLGLTRK
jgi:hypothetical protein